MISLSDQYDIDIATSRSVSAKQCGDAKRSTIYTHLVFDPKSPPTQNSWMPECMRSYHFVAADAVVRFKATRVC